MGFTNGQNCPDPLNAECTQEKQYMTKLKFEPIELAPSFYQLGTPFFPVYLSVGDKAMLIEGGTGATYDIIVSQLEILGIDPLRIEYIALTHSHADHIGAFPRFKSVWPHIQIVASEAAGKTIVHPNAIKQFHWLDKKIAQTLQANQFIEELPLQMENCSFDIDVTVKEGDVIDLGKGIKWTVHEIPGHAPCQLAFFEISQGILAIGDATGFYNPIRDGLWPNYFGGLDQYCDSIKKLAGLQATKLVLSHNGARNNAQEFLTKALKVTGEYHQEMLDRIGNSEDPEKIVEEKSQWVQSIADLMPPEIIPPLCGLLIKLSQKAGPRPEGYFSL